MSGTGFESGKTEEPKECPQSIDGRCSKCRGKLEPHYGCTPYGIGIHAMCQECSTVHDFVEDQV